MYMRWVLCVLFHCSPASFSWAIGMIWALSILLIFSLRNYCKTEPLSVQVAHLTLVYFLGWADVTMS